MNRRRSNVLNLLWITFHHLTRSRVLGGFVELAGCHAFDLRLPAWVRVRLYAVDFFHRATENAGPFACGLAFPALTVGRYFADEAWFELVDGVERATMPLLREVGQRPDGLQRGVMP